MLYSSRSFKGYRLDVVKSIFERLHVKILVALVLSILLQSLFLWIIKDTPNNFFNGSFVPLWTHDAGLYGFYAKELLSGVNLPFETEYMAGWLLYALVKILPFSIDTILFFSPIFISSLIIIPIIYMTKLFDLVKVGFFGGILATLAYGYYYRSFFGYYDTDILNLFFPLLAILGVIGLAKTKNRFFGLIASFGILGFNLWYHSFEAIALGIIAFWTLFVLIFQRDSLANYLTIFMMGIALLHVEPSMQIVAILILFALSFIPIKIDEKYLLLGFFILVGVGLFVVDVGSLYERALDYISKGAFISSGGNLTFLNTLTTVGEAGKISLERWGMLTASHISLAFLGVFGYILLCIRHKKFLLLLPLVFIGLLSMLAGERFVMFGVSVVALGVAYFAHEITQFLPKYKNRAFASLMIVATLFYAQKVIYLAKIEVPVFNGEDLKVLEKVKDDKKNFIFSWWDYGWPLWYETRAKTLIDNGKHFEDNYIVSKLLFTQNQAFVANASKNSVRLFQEANQKGSPKLVPYLFKKYKPENLLQELAKPSKAIRPIYWYLNTDLLEVANNIKSFSDIDPISGKRVGGGLFIYLRKTNAINFNPQNGVLNIQGQKFNIQSYTNLEKKSFQQYSGIDIQFIETKTHYLVCTSNIFNSFFIQALLFHRVHSSLFEVVAKNDSSILLRVK